MDIFQGTFSYSNLQSHLKFDLVLCRKVLKHPRSAFLMHLNVTRRHPTQRRFSIVMLINVRYCNATLTSSISHVCLYSVECLAQIWSSRKVNILINKDETISSLSPPLKYNVILNQTQVYHLVDEGPCDLLNGLIWQRISVSLQSTTHMSTLVRNSLF